MSDTHVPYNGHSPLGKVASLPNNDPRVQPEFNYHEAIAWVKELESGRWIPHIGKLRDDAENTERCCLGVAGEVCIARDLAEWTKIMPYDTYAAKFALKALDGDRDKSSIYLPPSLAARFGLGRELALEYRNDNSQTLLANVQDLGASFAEIANILRMYYYGHATLKQLVDAFGLLRGWRMENT